MFIINTSKVSERFIALRALSNEGINPLTELSKDFQDLFNLDSADPDEFVQNLNFLREYAEDQASLQAAFYALGLKTFLMNGLRERRNMLLFKLHGEHWDTNDSGNVEILETRGLNIIAQLYDFASTVKRRQSDDVRNLVDIARIAASRHVLTASIRRDLNLAADKADPRA